MSDQATFRAALLDPAASSPLGLIDGIGQPAGRRFGIYRNNVAVALGDALLAGFPLVANILGETNFKQLAAIFLRRHPPTSPILARYGKEFPHFISEFQPLSHLGYLPDIARLDLLMRESFDAADAVPISAEKLAAIAPDDLDAARLSLAPSLRLLSSPWPVFDIWRFNSQTDAPRPRAISQDIAVFRPAFDPQPYLLPPGGHGILSALLAGAPLARAAAAAPEADLTAILSLLLAQGAITDIHININMRTPH